MKRIYRNMLLAAVAAATLTACSMKEDPVFDQSASQRVDATMESVRKVLQAADNGWRMEYYGSLSLGGYNVMVKFEGDQATVASEQFGTSHKAGIGSDGKCVTTTSHYKLEQSMGVILSFDEHNETLHYFSMPNNPDYTYDTAEGLNGDFEFRVMTANPDSVILRGKKHNNKIVMTPIPADQTWESIISEADETQTYMSSRLYTLAGDDLPEGKVVTATSNGGYRSLVFEYRDKFDQKQTVVAPYIVKGDGFWFYNAVDIDGIELDGLLKGETDDYFVFRNNPRLQLDTAMPTLAESLVGSNWYFLYGSLGDYARPKWDAMMEVLKTAGKNKDEVKIYTATIGLTSEGKVAMSMSTSTDAPYWGFTVENLNEEQTRVRINSYSTVRNKAGRDYYNKYKWNDVLNTIYGHTFDLSCDYQRRPLWIRLTDVNDPTNVITVYANPSYFIEDQSYYQDKN